MVHDGLELLGCDHQERSLVLPDEPLIPHELDITFRNARTDLEVTPTNLLEQLAPSSILEGLAVIQSAARRYPEGFSERRGYVHHQHPASWREDQQTRRQPVDLFHEWTLYSIPQSF
jgi:hypothetical protein